MIVDKQVGSADYDPNFCPEVPSFLQKVEVAFEDDRAMTLFSFSFSFLVWVLVLVSKR